MRYPVEDGTLQQKLIAQREAWYQEKLDFSSELAAEWTTDEFTAFFGTQEKLVNRSDPIDIMIRLIDLWNTTNFDANFVATIKQDTKASFQINMNNINIVVGILQKFISSNFSRLKTRSRHSLMRSKRVLSGLRL